MRYALWDCDISESGDKDSLSNGQHGSANLADSCVVVSDVLLVDDGFVE